MRLSYNATLCYLAKGFRKLFKTKAVKGVERGQEGLDISWQPYQGKRICWDEKSETIYIKEVSSLS